MEIFFWLLGGIAATFLLTAFFGAPYVPTLGVVKKDLYGGLLKISAKDVVVDLGCGDGTVLLDAAKRGAKVVGYEINPILVGIAWLRLRRYGGHVYLANMWQLRALPVGVTIVYYFGASRDIPKLQKCLQRWGRGYRLVSFGFEVPGLKLLARQRALNVYKV